ncbi:MAG: head GIN domain-containing protein [Flavobacteriales bacterium]|nr:head GIN domain-containing protein [Flavobacteriales bacterium]
MKTQITFKTVLFSLLAISILATSCTKDIRKKGSGILQTTTRNLDSFTDVNADGEYNIIAHISDDPHVVITTDDNLIDDVQTFVQDNTLIIEMDNDVLNYRPTKMEIHVYASAFSRVDLNGSLEFVIQDTTDVSTFSLFHNGSGRAEVLANCDELWMEVNGSADMVSAGISTNATYKINGSGKINSIEMAAYDVDAYINGSGDIYVNCSHHLHADIDGSGNIRYIGSPTVESSINGSGNVGPY